MAPPGTESDTDGMAGQVAGDGLGPPDDEEPNNKSENDPLQFVVPDDAAGLEADRRAWQREQRSRRHRARWSRFLPNGDFAPLFLAAAILAVSAVAGSVLVASRPSQERTARPRPLASPAVAAGQVGGLLPDVRVQVGGALVPARLLRPAVLLLVPASCECTDTVASVSGQAVAYRLQMFVVGTSAATVLRLASHASGGAARAAVDVTGAFTAAYGRGAPTALLVRADGVLTAVVPGVTAAARLESRLRPLPQDGD